MRQGDVLVMTPVRIGKRGRAEAEHEGRRVRIAGGIVGEAARVTVTHVSKGGPVAAARFDAPAKEPHPARRDPLCPIHDTCGGCGMQQIEAEVALEQKVAQARALLPGDWKEPIRAPHAFGYRAKTFLLPQRRRGSRLHLGARPPRGERLVDTSGCAVLRPELEALAGRVRLALQSRIDLEETLRSVLLRCNRAGKTQATLVHAGPAPAARVEADALFFQRHDAPGNRICSHRDEVLVSGEPLVESFGPLRACVPATAFLQGNPDVAERLYTAIAGELDRDRIGELYCGGGVAGLMALHASRGATLVGVDRSPRAVAAARFNARLNGLEGRCRFVPAPAEEVAPDWEVVLTNPPRAGCHESVVRAIGKSGAEKLVYLSCNPATLARDTERLGWRLESVQPADMYPQTPHLELLAVLTRP